MTEFRQGLKGEKYIEIFWDQVHRWMAARSNLDDERNKKEYERAYKELLKFFGKHLN